MKYDNGLVRLTADIIIEFIDGSIVLVKRRHSPFKDQWAIPGGKMEGSESIEETALREAKEETGLEVLITRIVGVYSEADRDPRGRFVTVAFVAKVVGGILKASSDAKEVIRTKEFVEINLAFDHNKIISDYIKSK